MAVRTAPRLTRSTGSVAVTAMLVLFMAAAGAPTPLYVVYQQQWGFPTSTLTLVFAAYVLGLLATILVVGALARRPAIPATLNASFERMLARYREVQRAMPELAPKPKKPDFRRRRRS